MADENTYNVSGWTGWIAFAAIVLVLEGVFHLIVGSVALFKEDFFVKAGGEVYLFNVTAWGLAYIIFGALALFAAASLAKGNVFGRIFTIIVASFAAVANMAFIPFYPIWSILMITIAVLVLWAVIVHGDEVKTMTVK